MKKKYDITIDGLTKDHMSDIFHQAIDELGIKGGQQIPKDMFELREKV